MPKIQILQENFTVGAVYDRAFPGINEICAVTDRAYKGMVLDSRHE